MPRTVVQISAGLYHRSEFGSACDWFGIEGYCESEVIADHDLESCLRQDSKG